MVCFKHQNWFTKFDLVINTERAFLWLEENAEFHWVVSFSPASEWGSMKYAVKTKGDKEMLLFGMKKSRVLQFLWNTNYKFGEGLAIHTEPESISSLKVNHWEGANIEITSLRSSCKSCFSQGRSGLPQSYFQWWLNTEDGVWFLQMFLVKTKSYCKN